LPPPFIQGDRKGRPCQFPMKVFGDAKFQKDEIFHPRKRGDV
jgi:hypothetical protein